MSANVTRKRSRADEDEELPPAKREPDQDDPEHPDASVDNTPGVDGPARDGQVLKKDEEFWFEDGTVILVARDTEFRVYKGVLAGLSSVFKALFADRGHAVRDVSIDKEQTFSCLVVHVSDSPHDLRHLLRICFFYKRLESLYEKQEPSYHEISAGIRLGDKYQITEWYSQSMKYLQLYFPSTLNDWKKQQWYDPPAWEIATGIGVISLGRKAGVLSILPSAFISCICADSTSQEASASGIGYGLPMEDGSRQYLSPDDLTVCLNGKTKLRTATITAVFRTFKTEASAGCKTSSTCKAALQRVLRNLRNDVESLMEGNPFAGYEMYMEAACVAVCPSCTAMVRERSLKEEQDVWNRLPGLLGIDVPGWVAQ